MNNQKNHDLSRGRYSGRVSLRARFFILFLFCLSAQLPARVFSQQVSLRARGATFQEIARELERQTGYAFLYNVEQINGVKRVDADVAGEMGKVLQEVLLGSGLSHRVVERTVVIIPAPPVAQERRVVSGKVTDASGAPLPGVTVRLKGTTVGAATDARGEFRMGVPEKEGNALVFSFVGYRTREVEIRAGDEPLSIALEEEVREVDEVVVTGYANIRASSFTGTATRVTREELLRVSTGNVLQALQVFDPSLRVARNNEMGSDPNTLPEFNIRGVAGIGITELDRLQTTTDVSRFALKNNPNLPVFILDGHEVSTEKVYDMDPNRIETITILKDAAATAMYGSRAANGVIVIETVAPRPGELRVTYNLTGSFTAPDLSSYNMMNAREKLDAEVAAGLLDEVRAYYTNLESYRAKLNYINRGVATDWLSQPLQTAINHQHSLYAEGGAEAVRFGLGVNYTGERGVMKESYRDRAGAELRVDYRLKGIQITDNVSFSRTRSRQSPYGTFSTYARLSPYMAPRNIETGVIDEYSPLGSTSLQNPLFDVQKNSFSRDGYFQIGNNLSINAFFLDQFQLRFQLSATYRKGLGEQFSDPSESKFARSTLYTPFNRGELALNESSSSSWNMNLMLMYNRNIGDHNINLNAVLNANEERGESASFVYCGFPSGQFHDPKYAHGLKETPLFDDDNSRLAGAFLQGNYTFKETYLLDLSVRADGSSKFGSKQRFAPFWSLGGGINLHRLAFLQEHPVTIARLKVNYGQTGRVSFSPYAARNTYQIMLDDWYTTGLGGALMAMGNDQLTWDNVNTLNIGADLTLWGRFTLNLAWYDKLTKDMVANISIPSSSGFTSYADNMGETSNRGVEMTINLAVVKNKDWSINVSANGAHNKNKIIKIAESLKEYNDRVDQYYNDYRENGLNLYYNAKYATPVRKYEEGGSEYAIFGMKSLGISPENGAELFMNRDGSVTHDWKASEQVIIGNTEPFMQGAIAFNARYKEFSLYTTFMYEFGGDLYNSTLVSNVESVNLSSNNADRRVLTMRWQKPGDMAPLKAISDRYVFTRPTSRFVQRNNTLSFTSLSLAYDMDRRLAQRLGLSMLRFQFSMNDIAVFSSIFQERGTSYPFARKFGFTLNASF
ncbi:MAG: SusC/RagA family TonB-linked outer membrane protein [Odoribacteraceae bacterium]|jgi:TonB-linked SusC/RagA family outer membrane protein|nr:SusC/RagA family TonB-linked outer membrane protein [Odoribacteraceae bacterium]